MGRSNHTRDWPSIWAFQSAGFTHLRITCDGLDGCGRYRTLQMDRLTCRKDRPVRLLRWRCVKCGNAFVRVTALKAQIIGGRATIVTHEGYVDERR